MESGRTTTPTRDHVKRSCDLDTSTDERPTYLSENNRERPVLQTELKVADRDSRCCYCDRRRPIKVGDLIGTARWNHWAHHDDFVDNAFYREKMRGWALAPEGWVRA